MAHLLVWSTNPPHTKNPVASVAACACSPPLPHPTRMCPIDAAVASSLREPVALAPNKQFLHDWHPQQPRLLGEGRGRYLREGAQQQHKISTHDARGGRANAAATSAASSKPDALNRSSCNKCTSPASRQSVSSDPLPRQTALTWPPQGGRGQQLQEQLYPIVAQGGAERDVQGRARVALGRCRRANHGAAQR